MAGRTRAVETVVVGGGHAGLIVSALLRDAGREHVVLDRRSTLGGGWLDRWDAFRLVSPNWTVSVPGFAYRGDDPDGFMPRDEIVDHFRAYAAAIDAPVELDTEVTGLRPIENGNRRGGRIRVSTSRGDLEARDVVIAAGPFGRPNIPAMSGGLDPAILSLHSHDYRHPGQLPPGGVLLVGSGQTGVQLAEELHASGRSVTISAGRCGSVPRWYRGKDVFWWLRQLGTRGRDVGTPLPTPGSLPSPAARFACNPQLSGHGGGHTVSLRRMAADGVRLAGRLEGFDGRRATFRGDLNETLDFSERFFVERFKRAFDTFAERVGEPLPPPDESEPLSVDVPELTELDLAAEGIGTVIWTSGFRPAFDWLDVPVLDAFGLPVTDAGQTSIPGLSFIGTPWLVDMGSANLIGVGRDAEALVARIVDPVPA